MDIHKTMRNGDALRLRRTVSLMATLAAGAFAVASCSEETLAQSAVPLQRQLDALAGRDAAVVRLERGATVTVPQGIVIPAGVTLDLNGGTLVATLSRPDSAGIRMLSGSAIRNGAVVVRSRGSPGSQGGSHAAILVGAMYGENPSPGELSRFADPRGWSISNVVLSTDKALREGGIVAGAPAIQVMGGAHDGRIENVTVPDSMVMAGAIHLDWGTVGPITSNNVTGSAATYRRGAGFTTHPHDITIRAIRIGRLTRPSVAETGSFGIRLSGVDNVTVSDVRIASVTEAAIYHTAGDLGYEFARPLDRARAHKGIRIDSVTLDRADGGYLLRSDSYADNVGRAAEDGYRPMLPPIARTDMRVSNVTGSSGVRRPGYGLRLNHQRGGTFSDVTARGFRRGFYIDEQVFDVVLERPVAEDSSEVGISVEHPYRPPSGVRIADAKVGGRGGGDQILIGRSDAVSVSGVGARVRVRREAARVSLPAGAIVVRD